MKGKQDFRDQLRRMLEQNALDDREYERLRQLVRRKHSHQRFISWRPAAAIAASILVVVVAGLLTWQARPETSPYADIPRHIAKEVLVNHINIRALDVSTDSLDDVRRALDRLDFMPVSSGAVTGRNLRLLGARYCTLQGRIATQIMFETEEGEVVTLYQTAYDQSHFGALPDIDQYQRPLQLFRRGVEITIWVEQGVLVAQARAGSTVS